MCNGGATVSCEETLGKVVSEREVVPNDMTPLVDESLLAVRFNRSRGACFGNMEADVFPCFV